MKYVVFGKCIYDLLRYSSLSIRLLYRFDVIACHCWPASHWQSKRKTLQRMLNYQKHFSRRCWRSLEYTPTMFSGKFVLSDCFASVPSYRIVSLQTAFLFFPKLESLLCYRQAGQWRANPAEILAMLPMVSLLCARAQEWQQEPSSRTGCSSFYSAFMFLLFFGSQPALS